MYARFLQLLKEKNVTAYRVGKDTGISQNNLSYWEKGTKKLNMDKKRGNNKTLHFENIFIREE